MKIFVKLFLFILLFVCSFIKTEAKGREVVIFLKDSTEVKGELLAVRDSLVVIAIQPMSADEDIAAYPERVKAVKINEIKLLTLTSNNAIATGVGYGGGLGGLIGLVSMMPSGFFSRAEEGAMAFAAGAIGGLLVGGVIGALSQDYEEILTPENDKKVFIHVLSATGRRSYWSWNEGIASLKAHSRFKESEPSYLRDTIDNLLKAQK